MRRLAIGVAVIALAALAHRPVGAVQYFAATPLVDFTATTPLYKGQFAGNLYDGSNAPPADYAVYMQAVANGIVPLDGNGNPSSDGRIVFLSVGMSNARDFWCAAHQSTTTTSCQSASQTPDPHSFMGQAAASGAVNHTTMRLLNGAHGSRIAPMWACAYGLCGGDTQNEYDRVRDAVLRPNAITESQVQVLWVLQGEYPNFYFLPDTRSAAYSVEASLGATLRAIHTRWPNVRMVMFSALNYTGYAGTSAVQGTQHGPIEPFSYEWGFSAKWLIAAKIQQWRTGTIDPVAGDLSGVPVAMWTVGTYLWGSGTTNPPNSLALPWAKSDLYTDFIHPSVAGSQQGAARLLADFLSEPFVSSWFGVH